MKRLIPLIIAFFLLCSSATFAAAPEYDVSTLYGKSAYFMNLDTGRVLVQKDADSRRSPASLTKVMTVLLALELCEDPANTIVTIPDQKLFADVVANNGASIYLTEGEQISVESLIYATMLKSSCDTASALAYHFGGGDTQVFFDMMNKKAKELGMTNTHFANAHGIDEEGHYSSAHDMAILTQAALQNEAFVDVISAYSYVIPANNKCGARRVNYTIDLLNPKGANYFPDAFGVKSGYTSKAGRCLITTAERGGMRYLCVIFGANLDTQIGYYQPNQSYKDTVALYEWAFSKYAKTEYTADPLSEKIPVVHGQEKTVGAQLAYSVPLVKAEGEQVSVTYDLTESIDAPVVAGETQLGTAQVLLDGTLIDTVPVIASKSIERLPYPVWASGFAWFGLHPYLIITLLVLLLLIMLLYLRYRYVQMIKRRRRAARRRKIARL